MTRRTVNKSFCCCLFFFVVLLVGETTALLPYRLERQQQMRQKLKTSQNQLNVRRQQVVQRYETVHEPTGPVVDDRGTLYPGVDLDRSRLPVGRETCCQKGLKSMSTVLLCEAPCCPGLIEDQKEAPLLGLMTWCEKRDLDTDLQLRSSRIKKRHAPVNKVLT